MMYSRRTDGQSAATIISGVLSAPEPRVEPKRQTRKRIEEQAAALKKYDMADYAIDVVVDRLLAELAQ